MNLAVFEKLLTNNHRFKINDADYRRVYLLNIVLLLYFCVEVIYVIFNMLNDSPVGIVVNASSAVLCFLVLAYFHKTDNYIRSAYTITAIMFCMLLIAFIVIGYRSYMFAWISVFLPMIFFLLGRKIALFVSAVFLMSILAIMAVNFNNWTPFAFDIRSIQNIIGAAISLVLLIGYFEVSRSEAAFAVYNKNHELVEANRALIESKDRLRLILDSTAEAIFGVDIENKCTFCNSSCLEMLGLKNEEEILGQDIHALIHSKRRDGSPLPRSECNIIRTSMEGVATHAEDEVFWRAGELSFDVEYNSYPQYQNDMLIGAVVTFTDNTIKRMHEQQIEYYSSHDSLTGLFNRSYFDYLLSRVDSKNNLPISVIMGDVNGLKLTNDVFGHAAGDELLIKAADGIKKVCRDDDIVARLGGDEFIIFLPKTQYNDALQIVSRIKEVLGKEKMSVIKCSMSLGCDTKTTPIENIDLTIKNAEDAMYKEKTLNRNKNDSDMINAIIMLLYSKCPPEEQHSANVSEMCRAVGEALNLPQTDIKQLRTAGFMHDIGKVSIHESILKKQSEFTDTEELEYRQHPIIGYRILNLFERTMDLAEGVYCHHEQWDGKGYPRGLVGDEIPLMARIIAVAGRYETILNRRSEEPVSQEAALKQLRADAGTILDPSLVDVLIKIKTENLSGK